MSIVNLLNEHIFSHPFTVIRRQAQVNNLSRSYHTTPFTVVPVMIRLSSRQGLTSLFKGLPSSLLNHAILIGSSSVIYNVLEFPMEYTFTLAQFNCDHLVKHLILKSLSFLIVTPFLCSGAIEVVQSSIVSDSSPFESIREGLARIFHVRMDRKLPFYLLVGPSVIYQLSYYLIYSVANSLIWEYHFERNYYCNHEPLRQPSTSMNLDTTHKIDQMISPGSYSMLEQTEHEQTATFNKERSSSEANRSFDQFKCSLYAHVLTDVVLYPFQTILYR